MTSTPVKPTAVGILRAWVAISWKSFGGGQAVQLLAYSDLVDSRGWLTAQEWGEDYGLVQLVPGINLIALSAMTGWPGALSSVLGLIGPAFFITVLLTIVYLRISAVSIVQAGVHGLVTAATAMSLISAGRLLRPALRTSAQDVSLISAIAVAIPLLCAVAVVTTDLPVFGVLLAGGSLMAGALALKDRSASSKP